MNNECKIKPGSRPLNTAWVLQPKIPLSMRGAECPGGKPPQIMSDFGSFFLLYQLSPSFFFFWISILLHLSFFSLLSLSLFIFLNLSPSFSLLALSLSFSLPPFSLYSISPPSRSAHKPASRSTLRVIPPVSARN